MIQVEELYESGAFQDFLVYTGGKSLLDFDEYRQSVFLEIVEKGADSLHDCKKAAWRVAKRMKKTQHRQYAYSFDEDSDSDDSDYPSVLWEDRHVIA